MKGPQIENIIYEYRYEGLEDEIRSRIPNMSHLDSLRPRRSKEDVIEDEANTLKQVLFRGGLVAALGVIYYIVSVVI